MSKLNGIHHIAISTGDIKKQIAYFSDVLGMKLTALYWMHGVDRAFHGFMKLGNESVAFVFKDENKTIDTKIGETHAGNGAGASAPGTMQHLAFNVDTMDDLRVMQDRIRSRGIAVLGPIRHGLCTSIYFAGPEHLTLEVSTSHTAEHPLDEQGTWIDPEVVGLAGISAEELKSYMAPAEYKNNGAPVPQPAYDPEQPHMAYPKEVYEAMINTPDEAITRTASIIDPPSPDGL